jgi:NADH dehydrogenase
LARNVAASLGYGERKDYRHSDKGMVVDLGPRYAVANPLGIHLSGYPAKFVARTYHLYALPRLVNRWAVALAYLTDVIFPRTVLSMGFVCGADLQFTASEVVQLPKAVLAE